MSEIAYTVEGFEEIEAGFEEMASAVMDLRPAWDTIHNLFVRERRKAFATQGATGNSGKWAKRKPVKRGHGGPVLNKTGRLKRSLTHKGNPEHIFSAGPTEIYEMGSSVPYAGFHQLGTGRMVERPPVDPTDEEFDAYAAIVLDHIGDGFERGADPAQVSFLSGDVTGLSVEGL